jgi:very-short-patch-repair endonuclease/restriction endonuclease S subunit
MPSLNTSLLSGVTVPYPSYINEQRAIAHILGTLDDKIELNRRVSETLEAMARALFKSWFVDFDPVRAKMNLPSPSGRGVGGEGVGGEGNKPRTNAPIPAHLLDFARQLRRQSTDAEALLWRLLRNRQIGNAKFRRQYPFPPYVLDFYCHELKLAVELDGGQHNEDQGRRRDARRAAYLEEHGIRILRFWNNEVLHKTVAVLEAIYEAVVARTDVAAPLPNPSPPTPLPEGEGSVGLSSHIADLFPTRLVDSELGEIPEGWGLAEINDIADVIDCLHAKKPDRCDVGRLFLQLNYIRDDGLIDMTDTYFINEADYQKWILRMEATKGDCVITNVGRVGAVAQIPDGVRAALGRNMTGIRCKQAYPYPNFLIECLLSDAMCQEITRKMDSGTILNALNVRNIPKLRFVQPDDKIMTRFEQAVRPLRQKMEQNLRESCALAALRDALLPKLISGEIRTSIREGTA